jgi:hypothetical protein
VGDADGTDDEVGEDDDVGGGVGVGADDGFNVVGDVPSIDVVVVVVVV